ncbi:protein YqbG [Shouchella clausii]|uniref:protein YqbG n=1 Tax=Shouchella clausii TaxID=79880 RepID=UPI001C72A69E|nr:DUF3199 family protein [Shouchella clausii]MBX0319756.1 DUF3199 family protein [Shouchella clausii]
MPLITPADVKAYSTFPQVQNRADELLAQDILEAEIEIEEITGHLFTDEEFNPLPARVKLAAQKLAQFYAIINSDEALARGIKQERFENYSYTLADGENVSEPDVRSLLAPYIRVPHRRKGVEMRMMTF